ncbi:MAG: DUF86 domain-containing protein [Bacteroidales bacterium]|nr:DUF86 domain-containing protein [Bacteroidales bacterium]
MRDSAITNKERLQHIIEAISRINDFIEGQSKESCLNSDVIQYATLFQFAIIGEAVVNIDRELLNKYPYPWHNVRSFRNFILHEYHAIEIWIVWETAKNDLSQLKKIVETILKHEF